MKIETGDILLIKDFRLPSQTKDKFFIVLSKSDKKLSLMSMTTSQQYIDGSLIKHGYINDRDVVLYCFKKDIVIGKQGFAFKKNTFVSTRNNILSFSEEKLDEFTTKRIDSLTNTEIQNLIYCFIKSKHTPEKYRSALEQLLELLISK